MGETKATELSEVDKEYLRLFELAQEANNTVRQYYAANWFALLCSCGHNGGFHWPNDYPPTHCHAYALEGSGNCPCRKFTPHGKTVM